MLTNRFALQLIKQELHCKVQTGLDWALPNPVSAVTDFRSAHKFSECNNVHPKCVVSLSYEFTAYRPNRHSYRMLFVDLDESLQIVGFGEHEARPLARVTLLERVKRHRQDVHCYQSTPTSWFRSEESLDFVIGLLPSDFQKVSLLDRETLVEPDTQRNLGFSADDLLEQTDALLAELGNYDVD